MIREKLVLGGAVVAALALALPPRVLAANQVVTNCSNDSELRADLVAMEAGGGGTLTFSCPASTILLTEILPTITQNSTIDGAGKIVLSGNNNSQIFYVAPSSSLTLQNVVLTNGSSGGDGGAIYSDGWLILQHTTIQNCQALGSGGAIIAYGQLDIDTSTFSNNQGANGGAIFARFSGAQVTITNSILHHNQAVDGTNGWGGALLLWDGSAAAVVGSDLHDNTARIGGAIHNAFANSSISLQDSKVRNNIANAGSGGGVYSENGSLTMNRVSVSGNQASLLGGGLSYTGSFASVVRSTFSQNIALNSGGGVSVTYSSGVTFLNVTLSGNAAAFGGAFDNIKSTATLTNVTIYGNWATIGASGIDNGTYIGQGTTLKNTIVAGNLGGANCHDGNAQSIVSADGNLSDDDFCTAYFNKLHDKNGSSKNPNLGPLALNGGATMTHQPQPGSMVIDAGISGGAPTVDQRGVARPQGFAHDIGAVEVVPCSSPVPVVCGDATVDGAVTASDALKVLKAAVASTPCSAWLCDFNGDNAITASDALGILRKAVGQVTSPKCPAAWDCHGPL